MTWHQYTDLPSCPSSSSAGVDSDMKRNQTDSACGMEPQQSEGPSLGRRSSRGIRWDEENLEENEKIKAELMPTKINEPKTPYHAPLGEDPEADEGCHVWAWRASTARAEGFSVVTAEEADMAPLTLEDVDDGHRVSNGSFASGGGGSRAKERTQITIAEASHRLEQTSTRDREPSISRSSGGYSSGGYASDRGCGYASCSSDGEGLSSEAKSLKRRKFEQHRKQHYNMKEALRKGKELASKELGDDTGDELKSVGEAQKDLAGGGSSG